MGRTAADRDLIKELNDLLDWVARWAEQRGDNVPARMIAYVRDQRRQRLRAIKAAARIKSAAAYRSLWRLWFPFHAKHHRAMKSPRLLEEFLKKHKADIAKLGLGISTVASLRNALLKGREFEEAWSVKQEGGRGGRHWKVQPHKRES